MRARWFIKALTGAALSYCFTSSAYPAMRISPTGEGEVLLFPYYSAIQGDATRVTIRNTSDYVKAVGVSVREGLASRDTLSWATYIAPKSTFTVALASDGGGGGAMVKPETDTCTVPQFQDWQPMSSILWDGSYSPDYPGDSFTGEEREQAGSVTVVELGQWHPRESVKGRAAVERDCERLVYAWSVIGGTKGDWYVNPTDEALPWAGGGLSGSAVLYTSGGSVSYGAVAIDGFARYGNPAEYHDSQQRYGSWTPRLDAGSLNFEQLIEGTSVAQSASSGLEAISALLSSSVITANLPSTASSSVPQSWIVSMPTKDLHTESQSSLGPFSETWNRSLSQSCDVIQAGEKTGLGDFTSLGTVNLCAATNIMNTSAEASPSLSSPAWLTTIFPGSLTNPVNAVKMESNRADGGARDRRITVSAFYDQDTDIVGLPVIAIPLYTDQSGNLQSGEFAAGTVRLLKRLAVSATSITYSGSLANIQLTTVNESGAIVQTYAINCSASNSRPLSASSTSPSLSLGPLTPGLSYVCNAVAHTAFGESEASPDFYVRIDTATTTTAIAFIERLYQNLLGRASDAGGLNSWLNLIQTQSATTVALGFLQSREFLSKNLSNSDFVETLYRTLFDREGDTAGTDFWLRQLEAGRLREMVMYGFLRSGEFLALAESFGVTAISAADEAAYGKRAFTERFYTLVLGRQPDQIGFEHWVSTLTSGATTGSDIANAFFLSNEYLRQQTSDIAFVETCYQAFFGRTADDVGMLGWLQKLAEGQARSEVLRGFASSEEFVQLAASYGIRP